MRKDDYRYIYAPDPTKTSGTRHPPCSSTKSQVPPSIMSTMNYTANTDIWPIGNNIVDNQYLHNQSLCRSVQEMYFQSERPKAKEPNMASCHAVFTPATAAVLDSMFLQIMPICMSEYSPQRVKNAAPTAHYNSHITTPV